jgi:glutathione S-transferase
LKLPVLYTFRRCPYAIRARLALQIAAVNYETREVALKSKPAQMLALSTKATVPVLELPDGNVIDESLEVMLWALRQNDPEGWLNINMEQGCTLIRQNDTEFKHWLDRYKYHVRYPEYNGQYYREQAERYIHILEDCLSVHAGAGLVAQQTTLVDAAIFPFVRQFAGVDRQWFDCSGHDRVINWLNHWEQSNLFHSIMHRVKVWQAA